MAQTAKWKALIRQEKLKLDLDEAPELEPLIKQVALSKVLHTYIEEKKDSDYEDSICTEVSSDSSLSPPVSDENSSSRPSVIF